MADIIFPDGTLLKDLVGNRNVYSSDPATSVGAGEIIYQSTAATLKVNTQTVDPTTNPIWTSVGGGGVTDHGALTGLTDDDHTHYYNSVRHTKAIHDSLALDHGSLSGLSDDDHTQYLLVNGSRALTGDLTFNKSAPSIIFDTNDSLDYDKTSNAFDFSIGGASKLYLSATDLIAKTNIAFLKTDPVLQFDSYDYFKYISASNALQLFIASTIEYEFTASALDLKNNSLNNANIPGTDNVLFILDQDNAGAGVSSSLRFNRGSTDGDAAIWWDETDDEFQFESDVGVTLGNIKVANIAANKVVTGDHGTAATDEVVNVCYGTSATPPAANTTTEGALYIQYTA